MRFIIIFLFFALATNIIVAQSKVVGSPIFPETTAYTNSLGEVIKLTRIGDNALNYFLTEDSYPVIQYEKCFEYAAFIDGKLYPSGHEITLNHTEEQKQNCLLFNIRIAQYYQQQRAILKATQLFPSVQSVGDINILVLLIDYSNKKHSRTREDIDRMFNEAGYEGFGSVKEFFQRASHGKLNISFDVVGWMSTDNPSTEYSEEKGMYLTGNLVREAVDAAENSGVDFSKYDNDNNGNADAVIVMHAGLGADHRGEEQYIWPHSWTLSGTVDKQVRYDGVEIDQYVIACEMRKNNGVLQAAGSGTFCHEFGHALGLPDLYDGTGKSSGLGHWALMSAGSWLDGGYRPSNLMAWCRYKLGWETPIEKNFDEYESLVLSSMNTSENQVLKINTRSDNEYFLIENRQAENNDEAQPGSGLAIYQVNEQQSKKERGVNDNRQNPGIRMLEADFSYSGGLYDGEDRGVAADLFPSIEGKTHVGAFTIPSTKLFSGGISGVEIKDITVLENDAVSFNIAEPQPTLLWHGETFFESYLNDGSIRNTIRLELVGDEFVFEGESLKSSSFEVKNLPLVYSVRTKRISNNSIELELVGKQDQHEPSNNRYNIKFKFHNSAYKTLTSEEINQSEKTGVSLKFINEEAGVRLFVEDFENASIPLLPDGWEALKGNEGSDTYWETVRGGNHTPAGTNSIQFYNKNEGNEAFWLITPQIDLYDYNEVEFSFWQKYDLKGDAANKVAISTDKLNWATIYDSHPQANDTWEEAVSKIPDDFLGQKIYLGFCIYEEQAYGWFWDDVELRAIGSNAINTINVDNDLQIVYNDEIQLMSVRDEPFVEAISIYNLSGQVIKRSKGVNEISTSGIRKGIYLVGVKMKGYDQKVFKLSMK
ncbi:M6 family metalloprotease domain-containing protein [Carboxylicivirga sp. N1Y90]|uniref:M6 family metalloprotease domain-containing protein n=1 Tax=Carboxylicivirga fragile TaxID=3417571 RepID=UPI003D338E9D|nr:M6 family metalloprotease domain-containing protein [Marinilabiliaceae bacterium N1Y90]